MSPPREPPPPLVSVCMPTYNHAGFLGQALDGVLMQETGFPVEVVVADDASSDGTADICRAYAARFPDRVRPLLQPRNLGLVPNLVATLRRCRGKYVAMCQGDDYWIDDHKLARQVELLEREPETALVFHNAHIETPDGKRRPFNLLLDRDRFSTADLFQGWLVSTASAVFRNRSFEVVPEFLRIATHDDLALFVHVSHGGVIRYIDATMSVYRKHPGGIMHSFHGLGFNAREERFLEAIDEHYEGLYHRPLRRRRAALRRSNTILHLNAGEGAGARAEWSRTLEFGVGSLLWNPKESLQILLGVHAPSLYRRLHGRRGKSLDHR